MTPIGNTPHVGADTQEAVARLMRQLGIRGADGHRGGFKTMVRDPKRDSAPDLIDAAVRIW
jgi:hypothetical protein